MVCRLMTTRLDNTYFEIDVKNESEIIIFLRFPQEMAGKSE